MQRVARFKKADFDSPFLSGGTVNTIQDFVTFAKAINKDPKEYALEISKALTIPL